MRLILDGTWEMGKVNGFKTRAQVPGSVYGNLIDNGLMEDPFWRDNEKASLAICEEDYEFIKCFQLEESLLLHDSALLVCEGLDTLASIFINDKLAGTAENMHRSYQYDIKSLLRAGENKIRIVLKSPVRYVREMDQKRPLWGVEGTLAGYQHIRKAHCMFGWDWGPILPDMGIWKSITIRFANTARLDDIHFEQKHTNHQVDLTIKISAICYNNENLRVTAKITTPDGGQVLIEGPIENQQAVLRATIENPQLWWPNGYGQQPLYTVEVWLFSSEELDKKSYQIGLRTIALSTPKDQWGREFAFVVNGIKIFSMGADYIPEDSIFMHRSPEKTERLIRDCAAANYNMLRVWGGGHYADDDFLALCDQYGLLVWQDFMFACAVYDLNDAFKANVTQEAIDNIRRMRHHACMALWCGNNEIETGLVHWGIPHNEKWRLDYLELFEHLLPELVKQYDPSAYYWPSSPSSYGGFHMPGDANYGDTHYWDVWHGMKPFEDYQNHYFRFCSEFGFQSFPSMKTIESFTLPEDRNIFSEVMENHQKNKAANGKIMTYLAENYLYPKDLNSLVYASQLLQADAIRFGVEHMRRFRGRCMGATYWQVNDCWPVASWASIDYFGRWKALHYAAKRFYAPVLLSCHDDDGVRRLNISNERMSDFKGSIQWLIRKNDGAVLEEGTLRVHVKALSAKDVYEFEQNVKALSHAEQREHYLEFRLLEDGGELSVGTHLFVKPKHFRFLDPRLAYRVEEQQDAYMVTVTTENFAKYISLEWSNLDITPSDNFFDLSKGEEKQVFILKADIKGTHSKQSLLDGINLSSVYSIAHEG